MVLAQAGASAQKQRSLAVGLARKLKESELILDFQLFALVVINCLNAVDDFLMKLFNQMLRTDGALVV